jgi:ABC-type bacteriocin/lantibiotic exporter with double-glycine peptidase domain
VAKIPPFYPQETDFSCAVACLRMVLGHLGVSKTEAELRELCDCTIFGTTALELVFAARKLGFTASSKHTLTLSDLIELTAHGYLPIVIVVSVPRVSAPDVHSFLVVSATRERVEVFDPQQGPRSLDIDEFLESWSTMNNLAIVIA